MRKLLLMAILSAVLSASDYKCMHYAKRTTVNMTKMISFQQEGMMRESKEYAKKYRDNYIHAKAECSPSTRPDIKSLLAGMTKGYNIAKKNGWLK